ncbi:nif-specific transcriptional activator NifA [Methylocystis bryophila]|uniref:Nif-specific regulatory protein n=1 Tax=Methylocystis bryophila TaxID=655015 RepID=A0A1W6N0W6_9HYPH|nr:nif-specific transcriptional activator NifA [Methylocystis bryophila]
MFGIYEISKILTAPARLEQALTNVVGVLSSFLEMRLGMIVVLDQKGDPEIVASSGWADPTQRRAIETLPSKVLDRLVATAMPIVIQDVCSEPLFADAVDVITERLGSRVSFVGVAIKSDSRVIGSLSVHRILDQERGYSFDNDLRLLAMIANLVGQTVKLHRMLSMDRQRLLSERASLEKALDARPFVTPRRAAPEVAGIIGESAAIHEVLETIAAVAKSNSTVLLRGESGTGKELFARAVHELSLRRPKPFIKVNCAALPESVLESELFGHERGAFTGALAQRAGRFELAHGGTLLLDEIGEISSAFQAKLLRVLQEGEFERVGGTRTLKVDVRLIFATNINLEEAVAKGEFRADLYYRISVVPVFLPPLRERPGDVALLAQNFLEQFNSENKRSQVFSTSAIETLQRCYFPGNVRELENCVRRTATLAREEKIVDKDFACASGKCLSALLWTSSGSGAFHGRQNPPADLLARPATDEVKGSPPEALTSALQDGEFAEGNGFAPARRMIEKERLIEGMEKAAWVQAKAARLLGLSLRQVNYALKKYNIEVKRF